MIEEAITQLKTKRPIFHSEFDFQFALAWEIQLQNPDFEVRLEYPYNNMRIDIMIFTENKCIPIELKYKTAELYIANKNEQFLLKEQGARDTGRYDSLKDIQKLEVLSEELPHFYEGYTIWITNDISYKKPATKGVSFEKFTTHEGVITKHKMNWQNNPKQSEVKAYKNPITLKSSYTIHWEEYSTFDIAKGTFYYSVNKVVKPK